MSQSFIEPPPLTPDVQAMYDADQSGRGFVMNLSKVWSHQPATKQGLLDLLAQCATAAGLTVRQRAILVTAGASTLGDAYCSLAWGATLVEEAGAEIAGSILRGDDGPLDENERALAGWARQLVRDPNGTTPDDVKALRDAGFDDGQIFALTGFVALRIAFSTVNDALGAHPDAELAAALPPEVRDAVTYGRPVATPAG
jgi:alkylhydroperoxidase family enzyme